MDKYGNWLCKRLVLRYGVKNVSSRAMRHFIRSGSLLYSSAESQKHIDPQYSLYTFAMNNPHIEIVVQREEYETRFPSITPHFKIHEDMRRVYDSQNFKHLIVEKGYKPVRLTCKNKTEREIYDLCVEAINKTGRDTSQAIDKPVYSRFTSIQGEWTPFCTANTQFTITKH